MYHPAMWLGEVMENRIHPRLYLQYSGDRTPKVRKSVGISTYTHTHIMGFDIKTCLFKGKYKVNYIALFLTDDRITGIGASVYGY